MKLRSFLWLPIVAVAAVSLYTALPNNESSSPPPEQRGAPTLIRSVGDSSGVRSQLSAHEMRLAALEQRGAAQQEPAEGEAEPAPTQPRELPSSEQLEARATERIEHLDDAFEHEVIDPGWAKSTESLLREAVKNAEERGSKVLSSVCKATFCRMEVLHESEDSRQAFEDTRRAQPMTYYFQPVTDDQGRQKTIAYFVREGQEKNSEHPFNQLFAAQGR
jgi:hypothetical protein